MKHKRSNKSVVPQGRIWWKAMGRHPLNAMIGKVVQRLRRERSWSLRDLACEAGLTKSYLCELEHGEHSPTFEVMLRLEAALRMVPGGLQQLALGWLRERAAARSSEAMHRC